jgi:2-amino-4-hydroxy-6-hydroxymethyldihydropteridine diphosphokinase
VKKGAWKEVGGHSGQAVFEAFVGVGSNVDPERNILSALAAIRLRLQVDAASRFYRNPAFPPRTHPEPPFINGVLRVRTNQPPWELKYGVLRKIEKTVYRKRTCDRYAPRTLDLDLLIYGGLEIESEELTLPDPEIAVRVFWAVPLAELLPEFRPPNSRVSMKDLVSTLDTGPMVYLEGFTRRVRRVLGLSEG